MTVSNDQHVSARVLSRRASMARLMLLALMALGLLGVLGGIGLFIYHVWYDIADPHGSYSIITSVTIQKTTGIHWWQCLLAIAIGSVLFGVSLCFYWKFYVIVYSGVVVALGSRTAYGQYIFYCELWGYTRAGVQRTCEWNVSSAEYSSLRLRQTLTFP